MLFLAGTAAVGFALSRFLKASAGASTTGADTDNGLGAMAPTPAEAYGANGPFETSVAPRSGLVSDTLVPRHEAAVSPMPASDPLGAPAAYPTVDPVKDPILGDSSNKGGLV